ncbi:MAG: hypothetical protein UY67_C0031G0016 [Candidatus Kaiserbacteria bacterium GW2011_GWA2_52_12]|nr:MAG: hypothetical protein UY67_C0031G0016 [Candidatus Kaiserbacteria bacterium GW2011_GWA2_52_12]
MNPNQELPHGHHHIPWLAILFALLAIVVLIASSGQSQPNFLSDTFQVSTSDAIQPQALEVQAGRGMMVPSSAPSVNATMMSPGGGGVVDSYYYKTGMPYPLQDSATITDTREFQKIYYNADIRTRSVQDMIKRVETTVRGYDGRVDQTSSSQKSGYVSFVVAAAKFQEFRNEIEKLVDPRFITVDINSQNLLPQKQNIEEVQTQVETNLTDLQASKTKLAATHKSSLASLKAQLDAVQAELTSLQSQTYTDPYAQSQAIARMQTLYTQQTSLNTKIANENSSYTSQVNSLDTQIKYANSNLDSVKKQDQNLLDNVATVNGTISISWISLWNMVQAYVPGYWIAALLGLLATAAYWWHRRGGKAFWMVNA